MVVGSDVDDQDLALPIDDSVDHTMLKAQTRRAVSSPFASQRLIVEPLDQSQRGGSRDPDDVFPLLVALQDLEREPRQPSGDPSMFKDFKHTLLVIYYIRYFACVTY